MKYAVAAAVFCFATFGASASSSPVRSVLQGVGIDQKLNAQVPLATPFVDSAGRSVTLGQYLGQRPAVLALVYYTCPALCDQILRGIVRGLRPLSLAPGRDFTVIAVSINPKEGPGDAARMRNEIVPLYSKSPGVGGWHFLTGTESNIRAVADAVGFRYRYDPKSAMYFHAAGIMVLTPEGRAARYLYGVDFQPKDLKLALVEASHNRIGSAVDQILLYCYHYDPYSGRYNATVLSLLHMGALLFLIALGGGLGVLWRRDLRSHRRVARQTGNT